MTEHQGSGVGRSTLFRRRFLRSYEGPYAGADALWWFEHPGTATPAGREPPDEHLRLLRRALFAPGASAEDNARYEAYALRVADHERALETAVAAAEDAPTEHVPSIEATGRARSDARRYALMSGLLVVGLLVGFLAGRGEGDSGAAPSLSPSPTNAVAPAALPVLSDLSSPGRVLLRMSNASPQVGGTLPESGTSAYQSDVIAQPHKRLRLIVECVGGDGLLIVPGANGLVDSYDVTLQCPTAQAATVQTFIAPAVSNAPFRIVVYERQPVVWKLLLAVDPTS